MVSLVAWLWRFAWFRYLCLLAQSHGPQWLGRFIWINTPFAWCLRDLMLSQGHYDVAARITDELRRLDQL